MEPQLHAPAPSMSRLAPASSGLRLPGEGGVAAGMERLRLSALTEQASSAGDIQSLIQVKERELQEISEYRVRMLEEAAQEKVGGQCANSRQHG